MTEGFDASILFSRERRKLVDELHRREKNVNLMDVRINQCDEGIHWFLSSISLRP
jgi:hypothetical protein